MVLICRLDWAVISHVPVSQTTVVWCVLDMMCYVLAAVYLVSNTGSLCVQRSLVRRHTQKDPVIDPLIRLDLMLEDSLTNTADCCNRRRLPTRYILSM